MDLKALPIIICVADAALHSEAIHLAAATGRHIIDATGPDDPAFKRPCFAVLIDDLRPPPSTTTHAAVFTVTGDATAAAPGLYVLPAQSADLLKALGALALRGAPTAAGGLVVAVVGAAGGAGASVLAGALCRAATARGSVTLVDANPFSGGLDLLLGAEDEPGARWGEISVGEGAVAREDVRRALPASADDIAVLTFARTCVADPYRLTAGELNHVVAALASDGVTVVDTHPGMLPERVDLTVILTTPELRPVAAAARIVAQCNATGTPTVIAVRDNAWAALSEAEIEHATRTRVACAVPTVRGLTRQIERGGLPQRLPRGLAHCAEVLLGEVA